MKTGRSAYRLRREQKPKERVHDAYATAAKPAEPARCGDCGALYRAGRWRWPSVQAPLSRVEAARAVLCPACHRIRDRLPAGYVSLEGEFFAEHRDEVLRRVRRCEEKEKRTHPLQRIMGVQAAEGGCLITTTDLHLARSIGEALQRAYRGALTYRYLKQDNLLRVHWSR